MPASHVAFRTRITARVLTLAIAVYSAACGGDGATAPPITVSITPATATVNAGATQAFSATATSGGVTWSASGGVISGSGETATWTAPLAGGPFTITATSTQDPTKSASATVTVAPIVVTLDATTATVASGGTRSFTATVANSANAAVTWTTSGGTITGGGATVEWTAPGPGGSYTVTATSAADPTKSATANITVTPVTVAISPATITVGAGGTQVFSAEVTGGANTAVTWSASTGTVAGSGSTVTWTAPIAGGAATITATSAADPARTATANVTVTPVVVAIDPQQASVVAGLTRTFTASVSGTAATGVTWTASGGTISGSGASITWTAPATAGNHTVTAASVLNPAVTAAAQVTVTPFVVSVAPATASLFRGQPATFTATASTGGVTWASTCGNVTANGATLNYTAPTAPGTCIITARSTVDTTRTGTVMVTVRPEWLVTSTNDANDGQCTWSHCSLREAITQGNAASGPFTIVLDPAAVSGAAPAAGLVTGTITLTAALPVITRAMTIVGPGADRLTVDAAATAGAPRRVLQVNGATVSISGVTLRGGQQPQGGGVLIQLGADVSLTDVVITGNTATGGPGGGLRIGGGSTARLDNVRVDENAATAGGGLGQGGGIALGEGSTLIMRGGRVHGNTTTAVGGGILSGGSSVTLEDVVVSGNTGPNGGGGIVLWDGSTGTITGGALRDNLAGLSAGGGIAAGANTTSPATRTTLLMRNVLVEDNRVGNQGGGIQLTRNVTATIERVVIRNNQIVGPVGSFPGVGAGIYMGELVQATLDGLTITGNALLATGSSGINGGGGVFTAVGVPGNATVTIRNSTIAGNSSIAEAGGLGVGVNGVVTVVNTTVSGNQAQNGGGLGSGGFLTLTGSTVIGNTATALGGGIGTVLSGVLEVANSLISNNRANGVSTNCATAGGTMISRGNNLSDDATCTMFGATDLASTPAGIAESLANNGGPTQTHALLAGSAAINAANPQLCSPTDQRGAPRVGTCDIGAFEFGGTPPAGGVFRPNTDPLATRRVVPLGPPASVLPTIVPAGTIPGGGR